MRNWCLLSLRVVKESGTTLSLNNSRYNPTTLMQSESVCQHPDQSPTCNQTSSPNTTIHPEPNRHVEASQPTSDMATVTIPPGAQPEEVSYHPEISSTAHNIPTINIFSTVNKHTKRYYMDRDDPSENPKKICWYHNSDRCKFGENC